MNAAVLIPFVAYLAAVQLATRLEVRPVVSASVAILLPYAITLTIKYILLAGYPDTPIISNLFTIGSVLTVVIQFVAALLIFKIIRDHDSIASTIGWSIGGLLIVVVAIPYLISLTPL